MTELLVLLGLVLIVGGAGLYFLYRLLLGAPFGTRCLIVNGGGGREPILTTESRWRRS